MKAGGIIRATALLLLAFVVFGIIFAILQIRGGSPKVTAVFPDGTRFTLLGVTMGHEKFTNQKAWHPFARKWLPKKMQGWLPEEYSFSGGSTSNSLMVWFTLDDARGSNVTSLPLPWTWYEAVGEDGFRYPMNGGSGSSFAGKFTVYHINLDAFPRRQGEFKLEFIGGERQTLAAVKLRNPVRGPFPEWKPERLPISRTNGPIVVTLESLREQGRGETKWVTPKWKVSSPDPQWETAKATYSLFHDTTGNRGSRLSFQEPAWKLSTGFRRVGWTNYSDDEKVLLADFSVPEPGTVTVVDKEFERLGVSLKIRAISGAGTLCITNGGDYVALASPTNNTWSTTSNGRQRVEHWGSSKPFFLIESHRMDPDDELRLRLLGSDGKEIPLQSTGWYGTPGGGRLYQQKFDAPHGVSHISLEVILSRARMFEFIVDPADVQRLNTTNK